MIGEGMRGRGHEVEYWTADKKIFSKLPSSSRFLKKWLQYADQFLIYPFELAAAVEQEPDETLFVVADQALGIWIPYIKERKHVVHCHDFLALRSSLGEIPENPTLWTGKVYQRLIQRGFRTARNFISVSEKTRADLHRFLIRAPERSEVIYNGLADQFLGESPGNEIVSESVRGAILHVGGNQWYKNRLGVLEIYAAYARGSENPLPLRMLGASPSPLLIQRAEKIEPPGRVEFLANPADSDIRKAYTTSSLLLFPSLEEGFGWPIAEAMAAGCPVLTTGAAPMTEVGGHAAFYLPRMPAKGATEQWASEAGEMVQRILMMSDAETALVVQKGMTQTAELSRERFLSRIEGTYLEILKS
jgi:glycosyltransferase involved in cell wall biosynthesis